MKLIDTCAIIDLFENNREDELLKPGIAVCSFNADELIFIEHRHSMNTHLRHAIKKFFQEQTVAVVSVPVSPGNRKEEQQYVASVDAELLRLIPDPSDAVLAACALSCNADIVTKDRHHLYTARLENLFNKNKIAVFKRL
ncbi:MAG TPA: PIN domain-containing protein [Candidatus Nanoarchaeia archaeon]|nr:PIN domain-containing protein [Candidatus Nanoarchaeia archaeon]